MTCYDVLIPRIPNRPRMPRDLRVDKTVHGYPVAVVLVHEVSVTGVDGHRIGLGSFERR